MPNRIIKESINESKSLSECSFFAQDLFKRLITYADDYGRFNLDATIMLARLYPREMDVVTEEDINDSLLELISCGKISAYHCDAYRNEIFGVFPNWTEHQRIRNTKAKCPEPGEEINDWYLRRFIPIALKVFVLERDKCKCQLCGKNLNPYGDPIKRLLLMRTGAIHFDHIVPVCKGGRATQENIRITCGKCNLSRKRNFSLDEMLAETRGNLPQIAADVSPQIAAGCRLTRAAAESNPIQSESNPNLNPNPNKCTEVTDDRHSMPVVSLPLNDKTFYPIEQDQIDKWSELYGSVDVLSELKKMIGWLDADPKRRKTRSGILRFIAGWLSRQQDKPHFSKDQAKSQNFEGVKYDTQFLDGMDTDPAEFMNRMDRMKGEQHE